MMLDISVGIELIFTEKDFLSRIDATAEAGLPAVEMWGWRDKDLPAIRKHCRQKGVKVAVMNLDPPVNVLSGRAVPELLQTLRETFEAAKILNCHRITTHLQEVPAGSGQPWFHYYKNDKLRKQKAFRLENYITALKKAAPLAEEFGITLMLEPLNTLVDHGGYFLSPCHEAIEVIRQVNSPALKLLFDCYHQQITEGNLTSNIIENLDYIEHIHVADVPGRHEPGTGEINYSNLIKNITKAGYEGYIGLEYIPLADSHKSLEHIKKIIHQVNSADYI